MRRFIHAIIAVIVVVAASVYVFRSVNIHQLIELVVQSNGYLLAATIPVTLYSHLVRALRWRRLLSHNPKSIPLHDAFGAVMIGYAANTVIPRSGELARPLYLSKHTGIPATASVSSVALERILDVVFLLLGVTIASVWFFPSLRGALSQFSLVSFTGTVVIPAAIMLILITSVAFTSTVPSCILKISYRIHKRFAVRVRRWLQGIADGVSVLNRQRAWPAVVLESLWMWLIYPIPLLLVLWSLNLPVPSVGYPDAFIILVIITIGITVAPTPGAIGVYHGFAQSALVTLYGVTPAHGLSFAVIAWMMNYGVSLIVGGIWFLSDKLWLKSKPL